VRLGVKTSQACYSEWVRRLSLGLIFLIVSKFLPDFAAFRILQAANYRIALCCNFCARMAVRLHFLMLPNEFIARSRSHDKKTVCEECAGLRGGFDAGVGRA